jgi:hypothetical protein
LRGRKHTLMRRSGGISSRCEALDSFGPHA